MKRQDDEALVRALLDVNGRTFADELGIPVESGRRDALFRLLTATLLFSVRVGWKTAMSAARELTARGWTTPEKMAATTWEERVKALDDARYVRYDESRSRMLGEMAAEVIDRYGGDLNNLRTAAERDPGRERALIEEFKGIGETGADIFFREAQVAWEELFPFADRKATAAAGRLGLSRDPELWLRLAGRRDFPRLVAALVRTALEKNYDEVREKAAQLVTA